MIKMMYYKSNAVEDETAWCQPGVSKSANRAVVTNAKQKKLSYPSSMHVSGDAATQG
jgi:hypothetical protein